MLLGLSITEFGRVFLNLEPELDDKKSEVQKLRHTNDFMRRMDQSLS